MGDVALAHDYLLTWRGAERVFGAIAELYPDAPIYTSLHDPDATGGRFATHPVVTSGLQRLPVRQRGFRALLPLLPGAFRGIDVEPCRVLLTSSSAFAHHLQAPSGCTHLVYCHSPFRYVWHERERALEEVPRPARPAFGKLLDRIRRQDLEAAAGVDRWIANSRLTRTRLASFYGVDAEVVHPPVDVSRFDGREPESGTPGDYLLLVGELVAHKRADVAIAAAARTGRELVVVGEGGEAARVRDSAPSSVRFVGRVDEEELTRLYLGAAAVLAPAPEEFGIVAVEAQAAGRPVVALAESGAGETVLDGVTGRLVGSGVEAMAAGIESLDRLEFDPAAARKSAARFSPERFEARLREIVGRYLAP